jgi:hypothetical protein
MSVKAYIDSLSLSVESHQSPIQLLSILDSIVHKFNLTMNYEESDYQTKYFFKVDNKTVFSYRVGTLNSIIIFNTGRGYYQILEFHGLKSYNTKLDSLRAEIIKNIADLMANKNIQLDLRVRSIDIAIDIPKPLNQIVATRSRARNTKINDQPLKIKDTCTYYLEDVVISGATCIDDKVENKNKLINRAKKQLSSYIYNKEYKEKSKNQNIFNKQISRFEVKILPAKAKKLSSFKDLIQTLSIYTVYSFDTVSQTIKLKERINSRKSINKYKPIEIDYSAVLQQISEFNVQFHQSE